MRKFKVSIMSVSGIWNTVMQSPMINSVLADSRYEVDILFGNKAMAWVYSDASLINKKIVLSDFIWFFGKLKLMCFLFSQRYDYSIASFPAHRIEFNILPFLLWIRNRCTHTFNWWSLQKMNFLSNYKILADPKIHDIEQNLNLLKFLDIKIPKQYSPSFHYN